MENNIPVNIQKSRCARAALIFSFAIQHFTASVYDGDKESQDTLLQIKHVLARINNIILTYRLGKAAEIAHSMALNKAVSYLTPQKGRKPSMEGMAYRKIALLYAATYMLMGCLNTCDAIENKDDWKELVDKSTKFVEAHEEVFDGIDVEATRIYEAIDK